MGSAGLRPGVEVDGAFADMSWVLGAWGSASVALVLQEVKLDFSHSGHPSESNKTRRSTRSKPLLDIVPAHASQARLSPEDRLSEWKARKPC